MNKRRNHCLNEVARGRTAKPESSLGIPLREAASVAG